MSYAGQPTHGRFNSWYIGDDGIERNRWTGETPSEMRARYASQLAGMESRGQGSTEVARMLRHSLKVTA